MRMRVVTCRWIGCLLQLDARDFPGRHCPLAVPQWLRLSIRRMLVRCHRPKRWWKIRKYSGGAVAVFFSLENHGCDGHIGANTVAVTCWRSMRLTILGKRRNGAFTKLCVPDQFWANASTASVLLSSHLEMWHSNWVFWALANRSMSWGPICLSIALNIFRFSDQLLRSFIRLRRSACTLVVPGMCLATNVRSRSNTRALMRRVMVVRAWYLPPSLLMWQTTAILSDFTSAVLPVSRVGSARWIVRSDRCTTANSFCVIWRLWGWCEKPLADMLLDVYIPRP